MLYTASEAPQCSDQATVAPEQHLVLQVWSKLACCFPMTAYMAPDSERATESVLWRAFLGLAPPSLWGCRGKNPVLWSSPWRISEYAGRKKIIRKKFWLDKRIHKSLFKWLSVFETIYNYLASLKKSFLKYIFKIIFYGKLLYVCIYRQMMSREYMLITHS